MKLLSIIAAIAVVSAYVHANPVITEFMADNTSTIADEDGAFSDWIEIHNPTTSPLDLNQWCLTDTQSQPTKWRFPSVVLQPGAFLVVWASGKDRVNPTLPLHTNFSLAAGGEYLALVRPDGTTIQQQFAPEYPSQEQNESYGMQFSSTNLVANGAAVKYLVPPDGSQGTNWKEIGFNDASWTSGTTGLGFGILVPGITIREVKKSSGIVLSLTAADTLLGGTSIGSETTVVRPVLNLLGDGTDGHYANNTTYPNGAGDHFALKATGFVVIPTAGTYSFGLSSSSGGRIRINGADVMVDNTNHGPGDHIGSVSLAAGMHSFEIVNWDESGGEEIEFYARAGTPLSATSWDANFKLVGDTANGGLAALTIPSGSGGVIATNVQSAMQGINASIYVRRTFTTAGPGTFTSLSLKSRYADGYVAYLNGALIGSSNAPGSPQWNSTATGTRTASQSIVPESVNITAFLPSLINGTNVLAVHGMNDGVSDGVFLTLPELVAANVDMVSQSVFFGGGLATPGGVNGAYSLLGRVEDTQFSVKRGFYTSPFQLAITSATPGVTIRYTTNGAAPTATTGTIYTVPLNISSTTVIRAAAFKTGHEPTNVDTQTYLFLNDVITQSANGAPPPGWPSTSGTSQVLDYGMDPDIVNSANANIGGPTQVKNALQSISTICITTELSNLFNIGGSQGIFSNPGNRGFAWERWCVVEMINPPSAGFPNGTSEFQTGAGIRMRGGYSRSTDNPKHAFHLYFREDYGNAKLNYPFFGRHGTDEFDQIDLRTAQNYSWSFDGGSTNNTFMREESTRLAQLAMGHQSGRLRYLHLYFNGVYWGLFETEERTEASFSATYYGGDKDDYDVVKNAGNAGSYQTEVTDGNFDAWQSLWNKGRNHKSSPTNAAYFAMQGLAADGVTPTADPVLLDVNNTIDYNLLNFYTGNLDGSTSAFLGNHTSNNWFGSRNRLGTKGGFRFFAHDFEHSLFNTAEDRTGPYTGVNDANFSHSSPMFLHQDLTPNTEYKMRFADRVHKHMYNNGALTTAAWTARWNAQAAIVDGAIIAESARWGDAKVSTPRTRLDWINAKNSLLNYPASRFANVISQLRNDGLYPALDAPGMIPFGGYVNNNSEVVMTNNGGTIYYMPDGSDPRAVGGALRAGALIYTSGTNNDTLIANGVNWKYLDNGSNQGTAWRGVGFDDSTWSNGNAEIGYGDADQTTTLNSYTSGTRPATTYFRKTFNVTNLGNVIAASVSVEYDDAAIVYINGQQAAITPNISANAAYNFYTGAAIEDTTTAYSFSPTMLNAGTNTIAVEVHQSGADSSDVSFNLSLSVTRNTAGTPFYITGSGVKPFKVRALNGATWSALVDATFLVDTEAASASNLVISEIMYNPSGATAAEVTAGFSNGDDFEYIELTNIGTKHVDLEDVYFYGAIEFNFTGALTGRTLAPGARVIVAASKNAFEFRYGPGKPVAGSYKGNLGNGGELVQIFYPNDSVMRSVNYTDLAPWPTEADGTGRSMVLKRPTTNPDPTNAANWRASTTLGGAPGAADSTTYGGFSTQYGIVNPLGDIDGDGLLNFLEYALGGNPNGNSQAQKPVGGMAGDYMTLTFTIPGTNDDLVYTVEGSTEPGNGASWNAANAVPVSVVRNANGTITAIYRHAQPVSSAEKQFLRLKVSELP